MTKFYRPLLLPARWLIVLGITVLFLTSFALTAMADTTGPAVKNVAPADGGVITAPAYGNIGFFELGATFTDPDGFASQWDTPNGSHYLKIDGVSVTNDYYFQGHYDDGWVVDNYNEVNVWGNGATFAWYSYLFTEGPHTVEAMVQDKLGNQTVKTWTFIIVRSNPAFYNISPAPNSVTKINNSIQVTAYSPNGINASTIVLKDGTTVLAHTYNAATGIISYNGAALAHGNHDISVTASDNSGNSYTKIWSYFIDTKPPAIELWPANWPNNPPIPFVDGMTITDGKLNFLARLVDDNSQATTPPVLKMDGQVVPAAMSQPTPGDDGEGDYEPWIWYVSYTNIIIADGPHVLTLDARDIAGNAITYTWHLNVDTKPTITGWAPVTYNTSLKPTISATVKDTNTAINAASIVMTLNGAPVTPSFNATTGVVSYTPAQNLANEKYYMVVLTVADTGGLTSTKAWKFYTNTYPDMADSNISSCTSCHVPGTTAKIFWAGTHPTSDPFVGLHQGITWGGQLHTDENNCWTCHSGSSSGINVTTPGFSICGECHGRPGDWLGYGDGWYHGQHADIKYSPANPDPAFPVRITQNRETIDCIVCHQPGAGLLNAARVQVNSHDIPELHKVPATDCNKCHAESLTREHARSGRVDKNGQAITCNTCHNSTDTRVSEAIMLKEKSCNACHTQTGHDELHASGLDAKCLTCHKDALTQEHLNNDTTQTDPVTNLVNAFDCGTCHNNTGKEVKRTIAGDKLNCTACHSEGHKLQFGDNVPADIPTYAGYNWTLPMEASLFAGENTTPAGYEEGQVILSNRRTDVTVSDVWNYYNSTLTNKGWVLKSGAPGANATRIDAVFEKQGRAVTVKFFNTALSDGTGGVVQTGYRLEIWYKSFGDGFNFSVSTSPSLPAPDKLFLTSIGDNSATLNWTPVTDPEGASVQYQVLVAKDSSFNNFVNGSIVYKSGWLSGTQLTVTALDFERTYYFKVTAKTPNRPQSLLSAAKEFTTGATTTQSEIFAPPAPTGFLKTVNNNYNETLSWNPVTDPDGSAVQYKIVIGSDSNFSQILATSNWSSTPQYTFNSGSYPLWYGRTAYAKIIAKDATGARSPWSVPGIFTVQPDPFPTDYWEE